jgi:hypothetical protein
MLSEKRDARRKPGDFSRFSPLPARSEFQKPLLEPNSPAGYLFFQGRVDLRHAVKTKRSAIFNPFEKKMK